MQSPTTTSLYLGKPADIQITEPAECDDTNAGSSGASSPRCSPPAKLTGAKRGADALSPAAPPNAPTPSTSRPAGRSGVRRSLKQRQSADVDDAASCSTATFSSTVTTPLTSPQCGQPSPFVCPSALSSPSKGSSSNAAMAPEVEVGSEMSSTGVSPMNSPERKIWMRPCNGCGFELHVRRVKCTECGTVQMSKRAYAAAKDEKIKEEERATDDMYKQAMAAEEAAEAASQLALICESPGGTSTHVRRAEAAPEESTPNAAAMAAPPAPPSPAHSTSSHASVVSQLARLTPAQLTKLRRMQKLRTLLTKLPPGLVTAVLALCACSAHAFAPPSLRPVAGVRPVASAVRTPCSSDAARAVAPQMNVEKEFMEIFDIAVNLIPFGLSAIVFFFIIFEVAFDKGLVGIEGEKSGVVNIPDLRLKVPQLPEFSLKNLPPPFDWLD